MLVYQTNGIKRVFDVGGSDDRGACDFITGSRPPPLISGVTLEWNEALEPRSPRGKEHKHRGKAGN